MTVAESEENMKKQIIIKDGTSKSQLTKAIKNFEACANTTVLKIYINEDHMYTLVEFNGISVTKWCGIVDEFITEVDASKMNLVYMF